MPHPRYRLYTSVESYRLPFRNLPAGSGRADFLAGLEAEICRRFNVRGAVCVPMARTGLYLALRELIKPGQTVIMSPLTIIDVVNMVLLAGGIPVFADILRRSCTIDPEQVNAFIDGRTGAVVITHLHGENAGAGEFKQICHRRGVPLIEDAAQAFGAVEDGKRLGTIGDVGIYSFGFYKNVNAWQGGMIVSQDPDLIAGIRRKLEDMPLLPARRLWRSCLRGLITDFATWPPVFASLTHPVIRYSYLHGVAFVNQQLDPENGAARLKAMPAEYCYRMTPPQAELALRRLERLDSDTEMRIARAARYYRGLNNVGGLIVPIWRAGLSNICTCYPVQSSRREALLRYSAGLGRDFAAQHLHNCADLPDFSEFYRDCPNARAAARELILLPTYPRYPEAEIERNIQAIRDFMTGDAGMRSDAHACSA